MSQDLITKIFNSFDPLEALPPNDKRYVEASAERHSVGLLKNLARTIRRETGPTCQFLSGHRGCGKTTELFRLRNDLMTDEPRSFVVYCEADQYIDLNDVEYTDVLLAVVQQLYAAAKENSVRLEPGKIRSFVEDLWSILNARVEPKDVEIDAVIAKLTFEIKKNPNNRTLVRDHLRRATTFLEAVNEVIEKAIEKFGDIGYEGLTIIVDNLDRIILNTVPNTNRTSYEALFIDSNEHLKGLDCHVIYTLPPALLYSSSGRNLSVLYGSEPQMLPMIPVMTRSGRPNDKGVEKLKEAVEKRIQHAGTTTAVAFDSDATIERLCKASGGYARQLMTLARSALNYVDDLPITSVAVEQSVRDARDGVVRAIRNQQQWQMLREVAGTKRKSEATEFLQLLDNLMILEYRDADGPWYDVNPIVCEAHEFKV